MSSRFGVLLTGDDDLAEYRELVAYADRLGFEYLGIPDTPALQHDCYLKGALAALSSKRIKLGPWVTNPVTRHPVVTAGAAATLDDISGGRAYLGIGIGASAVWNLGLKEATHPELEDSVRLIRELYAKHEAVYGGKVVRLRWTKRPVPIYVAASGPKMLRLAGRIGDGVIVAAGVLPEVVSDCLGYIEQGAKDSGRRLADLDVWWSVMGSLHEDRDKALDAIKAHLATFANSAFRFTTAGKHLPPELEPAIRRLMAEYRPEEHVHEGPDRKHASLADETGLTPYIARRAAIVGTPEDAVEQIKKAHRAGAEQLFIALRVPEKRRILQLWEQRVLPALS